MFKTIESDVLKIAGFLLILGLVVGLWIGLWMGFNPQTHRQVTREMNSTQTFFVKMRTEFSTSMRKWEAQFKTGEKVTASPKTTSQPTSTLWRQVTDAFKSLWKSIQSEWVKLTVSLRKSQT